MTEQGHMRGSSSPLTYFQFPSSSFLNHPSVYISASLFSNQSSEGMEIEGIFLLTEKRYAQNQIIWNKLSIVTIPKENANTKAVGEVNLYFQWYKQNENNETPIVTKWSRT